MLATKLYKNNYLRLTLIVWLWKKCIIFNRNIKNRKKLNRMFKRIK